MTKYQTKSFEAFNNLFPLSVKTNFPSPNFLPVGLNFNAPLLTNTFLPLEAFGCCPLLTLLRIEWISLTSLKGTLTITYSQKHYLNNFLLNVR